MKRGTRNMVAAGMVTAGLAACASPHETPNSKEMQTAFDTVRGYWAQQGVPGMDQVQLVTLGKSTESVTCTDFSDKTTYVDTLSQSVEYCDGENTIAMSRYTMDGLESALKKQGATPTVIANLVLGHAVQDQKGYTASLEKKVAELNADCLSGQALAVTGPDSATSVPAFYGELHSDVHHGTPAESVVAFMQGYNGQGCGYDVAASR